MRPRTRRSLAWPRLAILLCAVSLATAGLHISGARGEWPDGETVAAMEIFVRSQRVLWKARDEVVNQTTRAELTETDALRTGLVGVEWSALTTTPGSLAAKRTTAHPLWVAVFRGWFDRLELQRGEPVPIGASGSFPGMLLAARIAAESLELRPVIIGSLTSSNYGANLPEMDLAEMDRVLRAAGLVSVPTVAFSPGGDEDAAGELLAADRTALFRRLDTLGPLARRPQSLAASIAWRKDVLLGERPGSSGAPGPKVFVNIGGHAANYGIGLAPLALPSGLISSSDGLRLFGPGHDNRGRSVSLHAVRRGTPVINVLNIRGLASMHGIPFDPPRIPPPATIRLPERLGAGHRLTAALLSLAFVIWLFLWRVPTPGPAEWFDIGRGRLVYPSDTVPSFGEVQR